jgi:hypothetical protein
MEGVEADARGRSAAVAGVARLDAQLGVGTAVALPPQGGRRGHAKPPAHWMADQRARWTLTDLPPDDSVLTHRFKSLSVAQRKAIVEAAPARQKRPHGNSAGEQLQKAARKEGHGKHAGEQIDVLFRGAAAGGRGAAAQYSLRPAPRGRRAPLDTRRLRVYGMRLVQHCFAALRPAASREPQY